MSLNRTLRRLFVEVRREARRNPEFAGRLDAALQAYASAPAETGRPAPSPATASAPATPFAEPVTAAGQGAGGPTLPDLNPVALLVRDGEDALTEALIALPDASLARLLSEHNLDPAGAAADLAGPHLVAHIVAQAQKRVERDRKLFDY